MPHPLDPLLDAEFSRRQVTGRLRTRQVIKPIDSTHVEIRGRVLTNFCSNNYLGLTHHPRVIAALKAAADQSGAGAGAAGLISGYTPQHASAESAIAALKNTQ